MLKKPCVNDVSEHLSMMSPVYTQREAKIKQKTIKDKTAKLAVFCYVNY